MLEKIAVVAFSVPIAPGDSHVLPSNFADVKEDGTTPNFLRGFIISSEEVPTLTCK